MELVALAKRVHGVDLLETQSPDDVVQLLEFASKFLRAHETHSFNDCTHTVFENFKDWWVGGRPTYKLAVVEDNAVETLYQIIGQLHNLGIPSTLNEKRSSVFRFVQEINIWGKQEETVVCQELIDPESAFVKLLGAVMGMVFPKQGFWDCLVFDATGFSKTKGIMSTSVHLVWPEIIVDKSRALRVRDYLVHKFKDSQDTNLKAFEERIEGLQTNRNQWCDIFNDAIYSDQIGIRMPFCDCVTPAPVKKPENRPFNPIAVVRFQYQGSQFQGIEHVCEATDLTGEDWSKFGESGKKQASS